MADKRQTGSSAGDKVLGLFSDPFKANLNINSFWSALGLSLSITVVLTLVFSLLRPRHRLVYAPRTKYADPGKALPPISSGLFGWIKPVWLAKDDLLVEKLGLDAVVFLRFTRMLRNVFSILAVVGLAIMIPVNVTTGVSSIRDKSNVFATMTPLYTWGQGLWAQVVVAYAIDFVVMYFIWYNYRKIHSLKQEYYASPEYQGSLSSRSILIRHIPPKMRSEEGILRIAEEVNKTGSLPTPVAMRDVKNISELIEKHEEMVRKLESILAKYLKNPERLPSSKPMMKPPKSYSGPTTGGKVDAIDYYRRQIDILEQNINGIRDQAGNQAVMSYGFATFDHIAQAHTVARQARRKTPKGTKIRLAPRPQDIIWRNVSLTKAQLRRKAFFNGVYITALTFIWTPINAGLAVFVSNLSNLGSLWPAFQTELAAHTGFWAVVQGIAAPAITSLVYLLLPMIFRRLQVRAGDVTKTARDRHVLRNLFNFFILNNLIIFSLFSAVWQYVVTVIHSADSGGVWAALRSGNFFLTVTTQLSLSISVFWVNWLLQRNLGAAIDIAQLWPLFYQWFAKTFLAPTPRQRIEWSAPTPMDYSKFYSWMHKADASLPTFCSVANMSLGSYYNLYLFYAAIGLVFSTVQPLVLVCVALYFNLDAVLKKYLLMFVFVTKTESGGALWKTLINRLLFSCILANVVIGVVVKARGPWSMAIALIPLIAIVLGFKIFLMRTYDPDIDFYPTKNESTETNIPTKAAPKVYKFRHPVLDKKLMTPMVPAKAKHAVQQIYSGRLDSQLASRDSTADIPLQPIDKSNTQRQNFETVPEGQMDYQFYKNRSDFGNVGADRMSRYDMLNSRPGTPSTFGNPRSTSPYQDSRSASPIPQVARKEIGSGNTHPALRNQTSRYSSLAQVETMDEFGNISMRPQHGQYTDPHDDQANLLRYGDAGPGVSTPSGEFMTMDQWRTPGQTPGQTPGYPPHSQSHQPGSYDYFRGHGGYN